MEIRIVKDDITTLAVDAIVNAAKETFRGGGGVDGAIHRAAGPELLAECRMIGGCPTGKAVITDGYRLPARFVIHTVGPIWHGGGHGEADLLRDCYRNCLELAEEHGVASLAFPAISTGVFGFPLHPATEIAINVVQAEQVHSVKQVNFVCFDAQTAAFYREVAETAGAVTE